MKRSRVKQKESINVTSNNNATKNHLSTSEYDAKELKGLEVLHDTTDFETGEDVILTLADVPIINTDDRRRVIGINSTNDILENINLTENQKRIDREKQLKRLKQPIYTAYDDNEFAEINSNNINGGKGTKKTILSQYDKEVKSGPKLVVAENGVVVDSHNSTYNTSSSSAVSFEDSTNHNGITSTSITNTSNSNNMEISLKSNLQEIKDYYSIEEYATFTKPKEKKKRRKIRTNPTDMDNNEEIMNTSTTNNNTNTTDKVDINNELSRDMDRDIINSLTRVKRLDNFHTNSNSNSIANTVNTAVKTATTSTTSGKIKTGAGVYVADDSIVLRIQQNNNNHQHKTDPNTNDNDELKFDEIDAQG